MSRSLWVAVVITVMAVCWGSMILGVGSIAVTVSTESAYASICSIAPEYRLTAEPPVHIVQTAKPLVRPA